MHNCCRPCCRGLKVLAVAVLATLGNLAGADQAADLPTVVVTGSHLPTAQESLAPVVIYSSRDIVQSGAASLAEWLAVLPFSGGNYSESTGVGSADGGSARPALRGLGGAATLVLVNGRRVPTWALRSGESDLNLIPLEAVDHVEILLDGASAVYGADAVAGVINIILNNRQQGLMASVGKGISQHGGAGESRFSVAGGLGQMAEQGWHGGFTFSLFRRDELSSGQRDFAATALRPDLGIDNRSSRGNPGSYRLLPGGGWMPAPSCPPGQIKGKFCGYDYQPALDILPAAERANLHAYGQLRLNGDFSAFVEALVHRGSSTYRISPTGLDGGLTPSGAPLTMPAGSPYNPFGTDIAIRGRLTQLGGRTDEFNIRQDRWLAGLTGRQGEWNVESTVGWQRSRVVDSTPSGFVLESAIRDGLSSGRINGLGNTALGDLSVLAAAQVNAPRISNLTGQWADLRGDTELGKLPGGPLGLALGAEWRQERLNDWSDPRLAAGEVLGSVATPLVSGGQRQSGLFAELSAPLLPRLETQWALRHDRFPGVDSATTGKLAAALKMSEEWRLLGGLGTGFRVPSLHQRYQPVASGYTSPVSDPLRCPSTGSADDCGVQFIVHTGGNTALQPEHSQQAHLGLQWTPTADSRLAANLWRIEMRDMVTALSPATILANPATLGALVVREPANGNLPGAIRYIDGGLTNIGKATLNGLDLDADRTWHGVAGGRVTVHWAGSYLAHYRAVLDGINTVELAGNDINATPAPHWRWQGGLSWQGGGWTQAANLTYIGRYRDANPDAAGNLPWVQGWTRVDWQTRFATTGSPTRPGWEWVAGIRNVFDSKPPASNQSDTVMTGWSNLLHDAVGRFAYASVRVRY